MKRRVRGEDVAHERDVNTKFETSTVRLVSGF